MEYIDFHVHSNFSDGTCTPKQLIELAEEKQLYAFALTDHDTVEGIPHLLEAAVNATVKVIPGPELSTAYLESEQDVHVLGYNIDYHSASFLKHLKNFVDERTSRNKKMLARLHDAGYDISFEQVERAYPDAVITRAHFARFMVEKGYASSMKEAFQKYLAKDTPYYVKRQLITPMEAVTLIKEAGGIAALAHPLLYGFDDEQLCKLIAKMKDCGLDGIEAIYSLHSPDDEQYVKKLAQKFDLAISGGSDFHGTNKPDIQLGSGKGNLAIPKTLIKELGINNFPEV